jgi:hypothetical protein
MRYALEKGCAGTEQRFRFIEDWRTDDWTMAALCRFYDVTRATGYNGQGFRYVATISPASELIAI